MKKCFIFLFSIISLLLNAKTQLKPGTYRGILILNEIEGIELPFNFDVLKLKKGYSLVIKNAQERITIDQLKHKGDSLFFKMPVFDTEFKCQITGDTISGVWINNYRKEKNKIKFKAYPSNQRFLFAQTSGNTQFEGRWETTFSPNMNDSSKALGLFKHIENTNYIEGTFLTETGDYRFLEGMTINQQMYLSCFDGSHAFLFIATLNDKKLTGKFYSGAHWQTNWEASENKNFSLRNANEITFLKDQSKPIDFSFKDLNGKMVSLSDLQFKNRVVLLQVMGSWCPNCMDESAYLSELYKKYKSNGLEIIALAFEKTTDFKTAQQQVKRLKNRFGIEYNMLITQLSGKEKASETLSALNKISAFPTLLFLNRSHQVVRIHTGFNGPATGTLFNDFKQETEQIINELIR
jgi:thiol-disulfide isomerase/thioredoxin